MEKINLQMFAAVVPEAVQGKKIIYLYRLLKDAKATDAKTIAFSTDNENSLSRDAEITQTKSGPIRTPGAVETEITLTSVLAKGDDMVDKLKQALINGEVVELWEVNMDEEGSTENAGKFKATYYQGYITELSVSSSAEDATEISMTYGPNGTGVAGYASVTKEQQDIASYVFADVKKSS